MTRQLQNIANIVHSRIDVVKIKRTQTRTNTHSLSLNQCVSSLFLCRLDPCLWEKAPASVFNNPSTSRPDGRRRLTTANQIRTHKHANTSQWLSLPPRVDHVFDYFLRAALCVCVWGGFLRFPFNDSNDQNWPACAQSGWIIILYKVLPGHRFMWPL